MAWPSIVILTGAGISKESGLDTFRDADGLWAKVRLEDVATPEGFARDPSAVHAFYNARRRTLISAAIAPNPAHRALARLEHSWGGDFLLVTQNIDDLHERAGSEKLVHMHGEMLKARCAQCGAVHRQTEDLFPETPCPACHESSGMRPHVVWFGELPLEMDLIYDALGHCGLFVSIGTSGNVYPAASFVQEARMRGAHTVELNLEPSDGASLFIERFYGPASRLVPQYVERLLAARG
jgi:NAD-dependent protein deacetylase/lipoamidase